MNEEEDLDELGEKLYDLIFSKHGEIAGKLTGEIMYAACCYFTVRITILGKLAYRPKV